MPIKYSNSEHRCNFEGLLSSAEIAVLRENKTLHTLQLDKPVDSRNWKLLDEELFSQRQDVSLRFYGFYNHECDISVVKHLPSLRHFYADCLSSCRGYEHLDKLSKLETLSIGVEDLKSFDFLRDVNKELLSLTLGKTKSSKPSVDLISRFLNLEDLSICGHKKGVESISTLSNITDLCLNGCSNLDLSWMKSLQKLINLDITLGGLNQLEDITLAKNIKYLGLCWIRGLSNLDFISNCENLQRLSLDRLKQVQSLPQLSSLSKLRWLTISDLKSLKDISEVGRSNSIEMLSGSCGSLNPADFIPVFKSKSLKYASMYFPSEKKEKEFQEIAEQNNILTSSENWAFQYV